MAKPVGKWAHHVRFPNCPGYPLRILFSSSNSNFFFSQINLNLLLKSIPANKLAMHFHDTRGMAIANIVASLELGIRTFDSSSGGLGGCPYAGKPAGNVSSEDVIFVLNELGIDTGVDLERMIEIGDSVSNHLERDNLTLVRAEDLK